MIFIGGDVPVSLVAREMADKGVERPCPCTEPKLPQFNWVSTTESVRQGKRLVCNF